MNSNKQLVDTLYQRQMNSLTCSQSVYYKNKVIKSVFNSKKFFKSEIDIEEDSKPKIHFSKNGNYFFSANYKCRCKLWKIDQENLFDSKPQESNSYQTRSVESNSDFSKIFLTADIFLIIDVPTLKIKKLKYIFQFCSSIDPTNDNILALAGCIDNICLFDQRVSTLQYFKLFDFEEEIRCIEYHPIKNNTLLSSSKDGVYNFDLRNTKNFFKYNLTVANQSFEDTQAKYNKTGDKIFVTSKYCKPIIFKPFEADSCFEFNDPNYHYDLNLKYKPKGCFAGINNEFAVNLSNGCMVCLWKIPKTKRISSSEQNNFLKTIDSADLILKGHASNMKEVIYNDEKSILATCGQDSKIILWSCFPFGLNSKLNDNISLGFAFILEKYFRNLKS